MRGVVHDQQLLQNDGHLPKRCEFLLGVPVLTSPVPRKLEGNGHAFLVTDAGYIPGS